MRAAVRLRPARRARRHARLARRHAPRAARGPARRSSELHDQMLALTPPGAELELHVNLLRHGRRTCHAMRSRMRSLRARRACARRGASSRDDRARRAHLSRARRSRPGCGRRGPPRARGRRGRAGRAARRRAQPLVLRRGRARRTTGPTISGARSAEWQAWADGVETWVATVGGERAGYYELREDDEASRSPTSASCPPSTGTASAASCSPTRCAAASSWPRACGCTPARSTGPPRCPTTGRAGLRPFRTADAVRGGAADGPAPRRRAPCIPSALARGACATSQWPAAAMCDNGDQPGLGEGGDLPAVGRAVARDGGLCAAGGQALHRAWWPPVRARSRAVGGPWCRRRWPARSSGRAGRPWCRRWRRRRRRRCGGHGRWDSGPGMAEAAAGTTRHSAQALAARRRANMVRSPWIL